MGQSQEGNPGDNLAQLLGSLLGGVAGAGGGVSGGAAPSITVTIPGVPTFIQGLSEFIQVGIFFFCGLPIYWQILYSIFQLLTSGDKFFCLPDVMAADFF